MPTLLIFAMAALVIGSASTQTDDRHVVMILIDGLPAYLFNDPQASLPVIRNLAREGVVADGGMHMSNPTITWPNQTSLITGCHADRHGVLFNGSVERCGPGELVKYFESRTQQELVRVPCFSTSQGGWTDISSDQLAVYPGVVGNR